MKSKTTSSSRHWIAGVSLLLASSLAFAAAPELQRIDAAGQQREYLLVQPEAKASDRRPLVLVLHGHLGTAANALGGGRVPSPLSAWLDVAERENLLVRGAPGTQGLRQSHRLARLPERRRQQSAS